MNSTLRDRLINLANAGNTTAQMLLERDGAGAREPRPRQVGLHDKQDRGTIYWNLYHEEIEAARAADLAKQDQRRRGYVEPYYRLFDPKVEAEELAEQAEGLELDAEDAEAAREAAGADFELPEPANLQQNRTKGPRPEGLAIR